MSESPYRSIDTPQRGTAKPLWIRVGLLGVTTRGQAVGWLIGSAVCAVLLVAASAGVVNVMLGWPRLWALGVGLAVGAVTALATVWYWLAIRWMDAHRAW